MLSMRMMLIAALAATLLCACGGSLPLFNNDTNADLARTDLVQGVKRYESGDYAEAMRLLQVALKDGLANKKDQVKAHKYLAFINCFTEHEAVCRSEFRKAFEIDPDFKLEPEEDGHPIWGPIYLDIKREFSRSNSNSQH